MTNIPSNPDDEPSRGCRALMIWVPIGVMVWVVIIWLFVEVFV